MKQKCFEVTLKKIEHIRVVVEADNARQASAVAIEAEHRGDALSAKDISVRAIECVQCN